MIKGASLVGVNVTKVQELLSAHLGIKIAADNNLRKQQTKVRASTEKTYEDRKDENREDHVTAVRASEQYCGHVIWEEDRGIHSTSCGDTSVDGVGAAGIYCHKYRGRQFAFICSSKTTGNPLALVASRVDVLVGRLCS